GTTWQNISRDGTGHGPHVDSHALAVDASGRLLTGNDGGVYRLDSLNPVTWESSNGDAGPAGLSVTEFVGLGLPPNSADQLIGGAQDNGTSRFNDDGTLPITPRYGWTGVDGGDTGTIVYD